MRAHKLLLPGQFCDHRSEFLTNYFLISQGSPGSMIFHISSFFQAKEMVLVLIMSDYCFIQFKLNCLILNLGLSMTNNYLKYKIVNRPSLEGQLDIDNGKHYHPHLTNQHRFLTEKKIGHHHHPRYHSNLKANDGYKNILRASIDSVEDQNLEYSQTELQNQMLQTLQDLGIRRGHSFQKEKIDFSLSSDVLNTQHQNQLLKKKMNEMKKELQYLRENDQRITDQLWEQKTKNSQLENELSMLKVQFMEFKQKAGLREETLRLKQSQLEQMKKKIQNKKLIQSQSRLDCLLDQLQNLKKLTASYEHEMQVMSEHYQEQLKLKTTQLKRDMIQVHKQFQTSKQVGQTQLNKLMAVILQKDKYINQLKQYLGKKESSQRKKSNPVSDNPQSLRHPVKIRSCNKDNVDYYSNNKYMIRFLEFQRLIDEKINQQRIKDRKKPQRISRSAIAGKKDGKQQRQLKQNQMQMQSRNLSLLLQRNEKLRYPDAAIELLQTQITRS